MNFIRLNHNLGFYLHIFLKKQSFKENIGFLKYNFYILKSIEHTYFNLPLKVDTWHHILDGRLMRR